MDLILRSIFFNQEKMRLLFLLLSVLFFTLGNAQNLKITYNVKDFDTQIPDTYASNPSYDYLIKKNNLIKKYIGQVQFELKATASESIYTHVEILDPPKDVGKSIKSGITAIGMSGLFYRNHKTPQLSIKKNIAGQVFTVIDTSNTRIWQLENDRKFILNKECLKATTTDSIKNSKGTFLKKITAWYDNSLPYNTGPGSYGGLPGVILSIEVQETNKHYKIQATSIENLKNFNPRFKVENPTTQAALDSLFFRKRRNF